MDTFAELLSRYINQAGISDSELARAVGVSRQTISRWKEGTTSRPNKREDILAISKKLRLQSEELDNLLMAAGFRPEHITTQSKEQYRTIDSEENDSKNLIVRIGKRKIFLTRRLLILIIIVLGFIIAMSLIDWAQAGSFNPFG